MRALEPLVAHRRRLVDDQVRLTNRLTSTLKNYFPQVLQWIEAIFGRAETIIIVSEPATVELYFVLARKVRTGDLTPEAQEEALRNFENDCVQRLIVEPLSGAVMQQAKALLQKYGNTKTLGRSLLWSRGTATAALRPSW
jgi:hypothetical protein